MSRENVTAKASSRATRTALLWCVLALTAAIQALALPPGVKYHQKISDTEGGFDGILDDGDWFCVVAEPGDIDGDGVADLAVGTAGDDDGGTDRGAVWVLHLNDDGTVKDHRKISDTEGGFDGGLNDMDAFGWAVASLGDLDGDGPATWTLAVGAPWDDDGGHDRGAVRILFMAGDGTVLSHQKISDTEGGFDGVLDDVDLFGYDLNGLGDLDGDGVIDLAVGAPTDDDGGGGRGAVWILFLNEDGTVKDHQKISDTEGGFDGLLDNGDNFGISVTTLGDLDGDNVVDLAAGAWHDDDGGTNRGAVWILFLDTDGTVESNQKISDTEGGFDGILQNEDWLGAGACELDDFDGNGIVDLAVGAPGDNPGGPNRGALWLLFLHTDGTVDSSLRISDLDGTFYGELDDNDEFGWYPGFVGDLNGDGVKDLVSGCWGDDDGGISRGAVWVLFMTLDTVDVDDAEPSGSTLPNRLVAGVPNPFSPRTAIHFELKRPGAARLEIYDVGGRLVRSFDLSGRPAGAGAVAWDGTDNRGRAVAHGRYMVRLVTPESSDAMQLTLIR